MTPEQHQHSLDYVIRENEKQLNEISINLRHELNDYVANQTNCNIRQWLSKYDFDFGEFLRYKDMVFNDEDGQLLLWHRKQKLKQLGVQFGNNYFANELARIKVHVEKLYQIATNFLNQLDQFKRNLKVAGDQLQTLVQELESRSINCRKVIRDEIVGRSFVTIEQSQLVKDKTSNQKFQMKAAFLLANAFERKLFLLNLLTNQLIN